LFAFEGGESKSSSVIDRNKQKRIAAKSGQQQKLSSVLKVHRLTKKLGIDAGYLYRPRRRRHQEK